MKTGNFVVSPAPTNLDAYLLVHSGDKPYECNSFDCSCCDSTVLPKFRRKYYVNLRTKSCIYDSYDSSAHSPETFIFVTFTSKYLPNTFKFSVVCYKILSISFLMKIIVFC